MQLFYAPQSGCARKVPVAAIELDLQRLQLKYADVVPGQRTPARRSITIGCAKHRPWLRTADGCRSIEP